MKGKNSTTCDPWTSRDFMDEMQTHAAHCHHCLSGLILKSLLFKGDVFLLPIATKTAFQIATISPIRQRLPQQSSGENQSTCCLDPQSLAMHT